jgi:predicted peroxiredoxin
MAGKAVISLTTGLEDPEKVTVAFLVAVGAAEAGRPTLMFQAKEAVRLALEGVATGVACEGCPPLRDLLRRYEKAGGRFMVCPVRFSASGTPARPHQARLVGDDHELGPVPGPELDHGPADVGLGRGGADVGPLGDLVIR